MVLFPKFSLERLEMRDLRKLTLPKRKEAGRSIGVPEPQYGAGVLVGNWFEDRQKHEQDKVEKRTTYCPEYQHRLAYPDNHDYINRIIQHQGIGAELLYGEKGGNYRNNYTTTTDLHFNHGVKCQEDRRRTYRTRMEQWYPQQDWACEYGNLTKYGLTDFKEAEWKNEKIAAKTISTEYQRAFQPYSPEHYATPTKAIARKCSSTINSGK